MQPLYFLFSLLVLLSMIASAQADRDPIISDQTTNTPEMEKQPEGRRGDEPPSPTSPPSTSTTTSHHPHQQHPLPHHQLHPQQSDTMENTINDNNNFNNYKHHLIVTVGLIVHRSPPLRFLLARRGRPPFLGHWSLIGGIGAFDDDPDPMRAVSLEVLADVSTPLVDPKFLTYAYSPPSPSTDSATSTSTPTIADLHRRGTIALAFYGHVEEEHVEVNKLYALEARWFTAEEALAIPDLAFKEQRFLESFLEKFHPSYLNSTSTASSTLLPSSSHLAAQDDTHAIQSLEDETRKKWPHAFLFDLDGTLVNNEEAVTMCYMRVAEKLGYSKLTREDFHKVKGLSCPLTLEAVGIAREHVSRGVDIYFKELPDCFSHVKPFPAAQPLLEFLKKAGIPIAIVTTNYHDMALTILEMCNLAQYIDAVFGQDDVAKPKPDPAGVVLACWKLKQAPTPQVLYIGDSLTDMQAATAAGVRAILVNNPSAEARKLSDKSFDDLDQVKAWLFSEIK